jgi:hypothetical protein
LCFGDHNEFFSFIGLAFPGLFSRIDIDEQFGDAAGGREDRSRRMENAVGSTAESDYLQSKMLVVW